MAKIQIENLAYRYPNTEKNALSDINLTIESGQFVVVVGSSGSGKTTLLKAIAQLVPDFYGGVVQGKVKINDKDCKDIEPIDLVKKIGIVFQNPESQIIMNSVEEEIVFGLENIGSSNSLMKRRVMEVSSALGLSQEENTLIKNLSGGQKQKVALASVLAMQPEVLILDEPTSQLDPIAGEDIITMARRLNEENGLTVILTEQKLERCFHLADRIIVIEEGKVVHDSLDLNATVKWASDIDATFVPPLSRVFAKNKITKIPITVKEGRRLLEEKNYDWSAFNDDRLIVAEDNNNEIEIKKLWHIYDNGFEALKGCDFKIAKGKCTVIMGENGSGKTTLLKNIAGLLQPSRGQIVFNNTDEVLTITPSEIGYLSQNPSDYLFLDTVKEELLFTNKHLKIAENSWQKSLIKMLGIGHLLDKNPRDLSTGERQRVALSSVLAIKPKVLLLDEPTRGLDYDLKLKLGQLINELIKEEISVVMVTHDVEFTAEYGDQVVLLRNGEVVDAGNKYEVLSNSTFYSPQIGKLFQNKLEGVITIKQADKCIKEWSKYDDV